MWDVINNVDRKLETERRLHGVDAACGLLRTIKGTPEWLTEDAILYHHMLVTEMQWIRHRLNIACATIWKRDFRKSLKKIRDRPAIEHIFGSYVNACRKGSKPTKSVKSSKSGLPTSKPSVSSTSTKFRQMGPFTVKVDDIERGRKMHLEMEATLSYGTQRFKATIWWLQALDIYEKWKPRVARLAKQLSQCFTREDIVACFADIESEVHEQHFPFSINYLNEMHARLLVGEFDSDEIPY